MRNYVHFRWVGVHLHDPVFDRHYFTQAVARNDDELPAAIEALKRAIYPDVLATTEVQDGFLTLNKAKVLRLLNANFTIVGLISTLGSNNIPNGFQNFLRIAFDGADYDGHSGKQYMFPDKSPRKKGRHG